MLENYKKMVMAVFLWNVVKKKVHQSCTIELQEYLHWYSHVGVIVNTTEMYTCESPTVEDQDIFCFSLCFSLYKAR